MLSAAAAASAIPRLRLAAPPRNASSSIQWSLLRRRPLSSSPNVGPAATAAGPGPLEPPNLPRLAKSARISLSPQEAEEFAPKIQQVVDLFGQLQAVDLESIEPSLRAGKRTLILPEVGYINEELVASTRGVWSKSESALAWKETVGV